MTVETNRMYQSSRYKNCNTRIIVYNFTLYLFQRVIEEEMFFNQLKTRIYLGYFSLSFIIVCLVCISIYQFISFEKQVKYVTEDIAISVKTATEIRSQILSLRTAVEKYIYKRLKSDELSADKLIEQIKLLIKNDFERMRRFGKETDFVTMNNKIKAYMENFKNVAVRVFAAHYNTQLIQKNAMEIIDHFNELMVSSNHNKQLVSSIVNIFTRFVNVSSEIQYYIFFHQSDHAQQAILNLNQIIDQINTLPKKEFDDLLFLIEDHLDTFEGFMDVVNQLDKEIDRTLLPLAPEIVNMTQRITDAGWKEMDHSRHLIDSKARKSKNVLCIFGIVAILLGLIMGPFLSGQIFRPINELVNYASKVSGGDLSITRKIHTSYEISKLNKAINVMVSNFRTIVSDIITKSNQLSSESEQLVAISMSLSQNASETQLQSENVAETSSNMTESINTIASAISQMNTNIRKVSLSSEDMSTDIQTITVDIEKLTESMTTIDKTASKGTNTAKEAKRYAEGARQLFDKLGKSADKIGSVSRLIKRIAEKTNILAINASIEASSAGKYGQGFAVVAKSIHEFADQSNHAANDIATRISDVQNDIHKAIGAIADISNILANLFSDSELIQLDVDNQLKITENIFSNISSAKDKTKHVTQSVHEIAEGIDTISENAKNTASDVNIVARNTSSVSIATKQTVEIIKEVQLSTNELSQMAEHLMQLVNHFKIE
jgi:methyl-accepting chemotaxis protein